MQGPGNIAIAPVGAVQPVAKLDRAADARQEAFTRALQPLLGKSMQAAILSRLDDGSFVVRVAGMAARMSLPPGAQAGTSIALTLMAVDPHPTFLSAGSGQARPALAYAAALPGATLPALLPGAATLPGATPLRSAAIAAPGAAPSPAPLLPAPGADTDNAALSTAARMISSVLGAALQAAHPVHGVIAPTPLQPAPGAPPAVLAAALRDAIGNSGLFYESHVAEWAAGERPLAQLLREPQMMRREALPAPTDPATAQFISLQLSSQEQGQLAWQGQLWPGQDLAWQVSRDDSGSAGAGEDADSAAPVWRSELRLRFGLLGEIGASVVLAGERLQIQLEAPSDDVSSLLRTRAAQLAGALEAAGMPLASLSVGVADRP